MNREELIDRYIQGELEAEALKKFEQSLKNDESLRNAVKLRKDLTSVIKDTEKEHLMARMKNLEAGNRPQKSSLVRRLLLITVGIILLLVAIFGYRHQMSKASPQTLYAEHFSPHPNVYYPVTRGNTDLLTKAFMAYESGAYVEAAELIEQQLQTSNAPALKFYQGICYAAMGNLPLAIRRFEDIKRWDTPYIDESYWYLGLIYSKQNLYEKSIENFQNFYELSNDDAKKEVAKNAILSMRKAQEN